MKVTIEMNPWTLPAPPVYLEGRPTAAEREADEAEAAERRRTWEPGPRAFDLLGRLREFVGKEVVIQGWDTIMFWLDDEGPYPVMGKCVDVVTRSGPEGHLRAYVALEDPTERQTPLGSSGLSQLEQDGKAWLFGVHRMYSIKTNDE